MPATYNRTTAPPHVNTSANAGSPPSVEGPMDHHRVAEDVYVPIILFLFVVVIHALVILLAVCCLKRKRWMADDAETADSEAMELFTIQLGGSTEDVVQFGMSGPYIHSRKLLRSAKGPSSAEEEEESIGGSSADLDQMSAEQLFEESATACDESRSISRLICESNPHYTIPDAHHARACPYRDVDEK